MSAKKKVVKKRNLNPKRRVAKNSLYIKQSEKERLIKGKVPTLNLKDEYEIALDFATKAYQRFDKLIKSVVLFGSTAKGSRVAGSDIDIIMIVDDISIVMDQELIAWYREELGKILKVNPYARSLHINTVKLSTWWEDFMTGDPVVLNVIRYGQALIDFGGFFEPLKFLLAQGKVRSTPEAIYSLLQRAPQHFARSKVSELNAIEGLYWAMVDSAHAALISAGRLPPSPEHIPIELKEAFVDKKMLKMDYVISYRDLFMLHKKISHGEITDLKGVEIDQWQEKTEDFLNVMVKLVHKIIEEKEKGIKG